MQKILLKSKVSAFQIRFIDSDRIKNHKYSEIFKIIKFKAKYKQTFLNVSNNELFVGLDLESRYKQSDPFFRVQWYEIGATIAKALANTSVQEIQINQPPVKISEVELSRLILGILQGGWHYDMFLSKENAQSKTYQIYLSQKIVSKLGKKFSIKRILALHDALILTRTIVNEPPETLHPHSAAKLVADNFQGRSNVTVKIYNEIWLSRKQMNGILFVGRGSRYQPRLIHVIVKPKNKVKNRIILVGKGLTYDSGGLDIKVGGHMKTMKMDMAGAATMFGVVKTLAEIGLRNTELYWISAFVENMIGPNSYKSDDIITTFSGQTVEVHNTDAEGRLTLADVLSYATTLEPDYIIDAATLTGAAIAAVSERYSALMGNDTELISELLTTFESEGEYTVHTPMPEILRECVKGDISDLINTSTIDRQAGHITAGLFLSFFINQHNFRTKLKLTKPKDVAWAHLDIAGSAFNNCKNGLETKGATGQSVRSLVSWVLNKDAKKI